jgi:hypothetical protein
VSTTQQIIKKEQASGANMFVIVETFLNPGEPSDAQYRVRPIAGQTFPTSMRVQCSRAMRKAFPLGSRFRLPVELVENKTGGQFLREIGKETWVRVVDAQMLYKFKFENGI